MRNLNKKTVYPPERVYRILGDSTPELNEALCAWSQLLNQALVQVEERFTPPEWEYLAYALKGKKLLRSNTGDVPPLTTTTLFHLIETAGTPPPGLRSKVLDLDYAQSWAVLRVCRWWARRRRTLKLEGLPWWQLAFRQDNP